MPEKSAARHYKTPDSQLKRDAKDLLVCVRRDAADFAGANITEAECKALDALLDDFDTTTTDEEDRGERSEATEIKDAQAGVLRKHLRSLRGMAERAFDRKGPYRRFGFDDMDGMSDNDLYMLARRVLRVGNSLIDELSAKGAAQDELTTIDTLIPKFDEALSAAHDEGAQRHIAAQTRIRKGNAIWGMMTDFAKAGKDLYQDIDEAKYRQYVLGEGEGDTAAPAISPAA